LEGGGCGMNEERASIVVLIVVFGLLFWLA
jgi:hypothetical protein